MFDFRQFHDINEDIIIFILFFFLGKMVLVLRGVVGRKGLSEDVVPIVLPLLNKLSQELPNLRMLKLTHLNTLTVVKTSNQVPKYEM